MPTPTPLAENAVAVLPVEKLARLASPDADPASMTYADGVPLDGADQRSVTLVPDADAVNPVGGVNASAATAVR